MVIGYLVYTCFFWIWFILNCFQYINTDSVMPNIQWLLCIWLCCIFNSLFVEQLYHAAVKNAINTKTSKYPILIYIIWVLYKNQKFPEKLCHLFWILSPNFFWVLGIGIWIVSQWPIPSRKKIGKERDSKRIAQYQGL